MAVDIPCRLSVKSFLVQVGVGVQVRVESVLVSVDPGTSTVVEVPSEPGALVWQVDRFNQSRVELLVVSVVADDDGEGLAVG